MEATAAIATRTYTRTYEDKGETRSYDVTVVTLPVTVAGETRPVEFKVAGHGKSAFSGSLFTGRIGGGAKTHRVGIEAWVQAGGTWKVKMEGVALNRPALAVGWADVAEPTSQHIGWDTTR